MNKKYFIAIVPPDSVFEKIELLKRDLLKQHGLKGALRSPAHITLHRPFEYNPDKEPALIETLSKFTFDRKFKIELINYNCFQPRVIYVNVIKTPELNDLHLKLSGYCRRQLNLFNETDDMRGFQPHITIASRDLKKQLFYKLWDSFRTNKYEDQFVFNGICLLRKDINWEIIKKIALFKLT